MGEINLNVRVPATDRQFLIVLPKDNQIKHLFQVIDHYHRKLFSTSVKVQFIRNNSGSVIDGDLHIERVLNNNDLIEACCAPVVDAFAGIPEEARASEKRAADELDAVHDAGKRKKAKKVRDPNAPRRPVNAFLHFVASRRTEGATDKGKEFMRQLGDEWKAMNEAQKAPFVKMKDEQKAAYDSRMKELSGNGSSLPLPEETAADMLEVEEEPVPVADDADKDEEVRLNPAERKALKRFSAKFEHLKGKERTEKIRASYNKEFGQKVKSKWIKAALKATSD